ncbi:MAG: sugar phosphate isomerase/epimerase [Chitinophagaceae bacterium]|nr:sugar phosphate isomerase/epimerase [Chitinophagaceae bacterium]
MLNRRQALKITGASAAAYVMPFQNNIATESNQPPSNFRFCLNISTLRGHKLGFMKELETASKAGFRSAEIWIDSLQQYLNSGGTVKEAKNRLDSLGITAENAIGFAKWIVDDDAVRKQGIEQLKKEMDLLAQIGCKRIAAPPAGATDTPGLDLKKAAERYRVILELGDQTGVVPQLEMWGFSKNLRRASEVMYVAMESGHPSARILLDIYHLYKGGSPVDTLLLVGKPAMELIHINDYPSINRETITDADRVHPGDGIAPIKQILKNIKKSDTPLILSEEVFNKSYYAQDPLDVAKTAMMKMKKVVEGV